MRNKVASLDGVNYYESLLDAQDVAKQVDGAVVCTENGWVVQYCKNGPYYPEDVTDRYMSSLLVGRR